MDEKVARKNQLKVAFFNYYMGYFETPFGKLINGDRAAKDRRDAGEELENEGLGHSATHFVSESIRSEVPDLALTRYEFDSTFDITASDYASFVEKTYFRIEREVFRSFSAMEIPRVPVEIPQFDLDAVVMRSKEKHSSRAGAVKVEKMRESIVNQLWNGFDISKRKRHPFYKNNLAVVYKDYLITVRYFGPPALVFQKTTKVGNGNQTVQWVFNLITEGNHLDDVNQYTETYGADTRGMSMINYMKICQLSHRDMLFVCMGSTDTYDCEEDLDEEHYRASPSEYRGHGCRVFDINAMIETVECSLKEHNGNVYDDRNNDKVEYPLSVQAQMVLKTFHSVWSCDTYRNGGFEILVLGTNEHKVRVYYHSDNLHREGTEMVSNYFYKSFPIEFEGNVPVVHLSKGQTEGCVLLTVGLILGDMYNIELAIDTEILRICDFLESYGNLIGDNDREESLKNFYYANAVFRGQYSILDFQNLGNHIWTITELDGDLDFLKVQQWEDLTGCEFEEFNRQQEKMVLKTELCLGDTCIEDYESGEYADYGFGALATTVAVPTFSIKKMISNIVCKADNTIKFNKDNFGYEYTEKHTEGSENVVKKYEMGDLFNRCFVSYHWMKNEVMEIGHDGYVNSFVVDDVCVSQECEFKRSPFADELLHKKEYEPAQDSLRSKGVHVKESILTSDLFSEVVEEHPKLFSGSSAVIVEKDYRSWDRGLSHIGDFSKHSKNLKSFFQTVDDLLALVMISEEHIDIRAFFIEIFKDKKISIELDVPERDGDNYSEDLLIAWKEFEEFHLPKEDLFSFIGRVDHYFRELMLADVMPLVVDKEYYENMFDDDYFSFSLFRENAAFPRRQRAKLDILIGDCNSGKKKQDYLLVTTTNGIYLLYGQPMLVKAYTPNVIFELNDDVVSPFHDYLVNTNRITMCVHIKELCCVAVASQIGLVSIMRLTDYKGIKSFRQECVFGLEVLKKESGFVSSGSGMPSRSRGNKATDSFPKNHNYEERLSVASVDFPMATIVGMAYKMVNSNCCMLYIQSERGLFEYKLSI